MPRKKSGGMTAGTIGFYKWKGEALPAMVVKAVYDSDDTLFVLNVFTPNGVMVVQRAKVGNGDGEFNTNANPAVQVVDEAPPAED